MTVNVYLDVDGIINAVNIQTPPWGWHDSATTTADGSRILYSPSLITELNRLSCLPGIRFHWVTTWDERAGTHLAPAIGLDADHWETVGTRHHYDTALTGWWKLPAIIEHVDATQPDAIVWVDDDLATDIEALQWVNAHPLPFLAVSPNCHVGLTRAETRDLADFLEAHAG